MVNKNHNLILVYIMVKHKCEPGKILRNSYTTKKGKHVKESCVKDMGKKGKGPQTLPKPGNEFHLSTYGYSVHQSANSRKKSLLEAAKYYGINKIIQRLNLLRNYQAVPANKKIFSEDISVLQHKRDNQKRITNVEKKITIYEEHIVNNKKILFKTVEIDDSFMIAEMAQKHGLIELTENKIIENINNNFEFICLKVDDELKGFFRYNIKNDNVYVSYFCTEKGYYLMLYFFLEKFFYANKYYNVSISINLENREDLSL